MKFNAKETNLISLVDQLTRTVTEVFKERGYDVNVSIAEDAGGVMNFSIDTKGFNLSTELMNNVMEEAARRIGGRNIRGEFLE